MESRVNSERFDSLARAHFGLLGLTQLCRSHPYGSIREQDIWTFPAANSRKFFNLFPELRPAVPEE
jgi:hypothetical protein